MKIIILKPNSFSGILTTVTFFFNKAKNSSIALATVSFFNAIKGKNNKTKNRKSIWFEYIILFFGIITSVNGFTQCASNTHSNNASDNWLSCAEEPNPNTTRNDGHWIQYDLGYIYPITSSHIWNYNVAGETNKGFKDVVIDYSIDGITWTQLGIFSFSEANGSNIYAGFEGPDFGTIETRYILITALSNFGNSTCYGLAECRFNINQGVQVSLTELENDNLLSIFPNPASTIINLTFENPKIIKEIIIRNVTGQELNRYSQTIPTSIDVSSLPEGVYFLIATTNNNEFLVGKFVKGKL